MLTSTISRRWDVCAGTIIAREAGAKVYGEFFVFCTSQTTRKNKTRGPFYLSPRALFSLSLCSLPARARKSFVLYLTVFVFTGRGGKEFEPQDLMGHHFFVVRAIEGGEEAQDRIAKEFFDTCQEYDV